MLLIVNIQVGSYGLHTPLVQVLFAAIAAFHYTPLLVFEMIVYYHTPPFNAATPCRCHAIVVA